MPVLLSILAWVLSWWVQPEAADDAYVVVTSAVHVLHDAGREKDLRIVARGPEPTKARPGPFPLIVFSHGMGGSSAAFESLSLHLASHGYVVVHPTHSDSVSLAADRAARRRELFSDPRGMTRRVDLFDRVADVKFLLDSIDEIEGVLGAPGLVDRERLGMAGHSAGAMTTQALGGIEFFRRGRSIPNSLTEDRFDAFAVISGQGTTRASLTEDSWRSIDRPWLVITGSEDVTAASDETPESRREPYELAPADGSKYLVFIEGARHSSFQGRGAGAVLDGGSPENVEWMVEVTNASVLAFFDAHVKGDERAKARLDGGFVGEIEGGELEFLRK